MCLTVTLVDGLVLARSGFHSSVNYRSVVVLGTAKVVEGKEKGAALEIISEQILPGRWADIRWPNRKELKATIQQVDDQELTRLIARAFGANHKSGVTLTQFRAAKIAPGSSTILQVVESFGLDYSRD